MPESIYRPIDENNAWTARDLCGRERWTRDFTPAMIDAVMRAVRAAGETPHHPIDAKKFPLPSMAGFLTAVHGDLENGRYGRDYLVSLDQRLSQFAQTLRRASGA